MEMGLLKSVYPVGFNLFWSFSIHAIKSVEASFDQRLS